MWASLGYRVKSCLKTIQAAYSWCILKAKGVRDSKSQLLEVGMMLRKHWVGAYHHTSICSKVVWFPGPKARIL